METRLVYMTAGTIDEAKSIGKTLVESRLAACVNILGAIESVYTWNGQVENDAEVAFIAKTTVEAVSELIDKVKEIHSYDCPCIVSIPIGGGNSAFLDWIADEVERK